MQHNENYFEATQATSLQKHVLRTFSWMVLGLLVTAVVAFAVYNTNLRFWIFSIRYMPIILFVAQIGVVISLSTRLKKMSATSAKILFLLYSALTGVTFSLLGMMYSTGSMILAFLVTAVYFGSLVIIGYTTKLNLLKYGSIMFGALIALIITEVVMMLMRMSLDTMLMSAVGLLIFTAITAYDAQKMKALYQQNEQNEAMLANLSIYSAFDLYLDFINIFLYMLRFLGKRN